jgi:uncharacterized membrane-anchored protein
VPQRPPRLDVTSGDAGARQIPRRETSRSLQLAAKKVPEITLLFWVTKLLTTAMGESTSDYLVHQLDPVVAVGLGAIALAAALVLQFRVRRYLPWVYWLAVLMVAIFGTMAADVLHIKFDVPYAVSVAAFAVVLAAIFWVWHRFEGTLSIHSIDAPRREAFYWATVMATFALGTAAGDLTAVTFGLGYLSSALLFAGILAIPAIGFWRLHWNGVFAFWFAYVLTRPLGASIADWLGKPHASGGVGLGDGLASALFGVLIVGAVGYMALSERGKSRRRPIAKI